MYKLKCRMLKQVAVVVIIYVQLLFISLNHTEVSFIYTYRYYYILLSLVIILKCIQADIARKRVTDVVQSYLIIYPCLCNYISHSCVHSCNIQICITPLFFYVYYGSTNSR
jgi:hypothetical protein